MIEARFGVGAYKLPVPVEEIAHEHGCSSSTIYRHIERVLRRLAKSHDE
jgi:DNA-directed RNA polymerase specialized sigma24 family protein